MRALDKKLWRETWQMKGQVIAIALVIMGGVSVAIMSLFAYDSLLRTRDNYYQQYRFADVFTTVKRAPVQLLRRVEAIEGVQLVDDRIAASVRLTVEGFSDPVTGLLQSIPESRESGKLNKLHLISGRYPENSRELIIGKAFAEAHQLALGGYLQIVINGRLQRLRIVGVGLSPEFIYQVAPGSVMPDYHRYGIFWMTRKGLEIAYDMDGAFNQLSLKLAPDVYPHQVIQQLDELLSPYGNTGAYEKNEQISNRFLKEEFSQLKTMAVLFPVIFLSVAVFLLNVVVSRIISSQRGIIGVLKAFGYTQWDIARHYAEQVILISSVGIMAGIGLGAWLGKGLTELYSDYYHFPVLFFYLNPWMVLSIMVLTLLLTLGGSYLVFKRAALLPPAEAMRPEPPANYRGTLIERLGIARFFSQTSRMILRHIERRLMKSLVAIMGVAAACAITMVGNFQSDAINEMMHVHFKLAQKEDVSVTLAEPGNSSALYSLRALQGVNYVEGQRNVPVVMKFMQHSYRGGVTGLSDTHHLSDILDANLKSVELPENGILLSTQLANKLHIRSGDLLQLEVLEGERPLLEVPVAGLVKQYLGVGAYMRRDVLARMLGEGDVVTHALLSVDEDRQQAIYDELQQAPRIVGIGVRQAIIDAFYEMMDRTLMIFTSVNATLGGIIAFGVIYNTVRIALAERERELSSLRVLGYTKAEVAYILLGEVALLMLVGIPLGFVFGVGLCALVASGLDSDLYNVPLVLNADTYAMSALVILVSALFSSLVVWARIKRLNLVEVLKTRE